MTFWCGSGSGSDPDPAIFVNDLQDANYLKRFIYLLLFAGTFTSFFKDKKSKRSNPDPDSGGPKNMWIWWILIRIRNTGPNMMKPWNESTAGIDLAFTCHHSSV
jgi:hypothetical protein